MKYNLEMYDYKMSVIHYFLFFFKWMSLIVFFDALDIICMCALSSIASYDIISFIHFCSAFPDFNI